MSKNYLVTYDLKTPGQDYSNLYKAIGKYNHIHPLESIWFINSSNSASTIYQDLKSKIDTNDYIFVSEINSNRQGWLKQTAWDFLNNNQ